MYSRQHHCLYMVWYSMLDRCVNPRNNKFKQYGARGVCVCDRWWDFKLFVQDMGKRPPGRILDRIIPEGNYEPGNCRWATPATSGLNKRNRLIQYRTPVGEPTSVQAIDAELESLAML